MTPAAAGIEPATFRFVAQHLNHCATAVPNTSIILLKILLTVSRFLLNLNFLDRFWQKILQYQILLKSAQWERSCSVRTEEQTDRCT